MLAILLSQPQKHKLTQKRNHLKPTKSTQLCCKKYFKITHAQLIIALCNRPCLSKSFVLVNAVKIQTYGNQFLLVFRLVLPVLADNIWWFLNHCFQYGAGCPVVDGFVRLPRFMNAPLFVAIPPACFNILIWKLLCKLLLDIPKLQCN